MISCVLSERSPFHWYSHKLSDDIALRFVPYFIIMKALRGSSAHVRAGHLVARF